MGYLLWLSGQGTLSFATNIYWTDTLLLSLAGVVTAVPLILYAMGAKLLRLSTIGIMQYIAPTMIFLIAVFVFKEPFGLYKLAAFGFIWLALALYSWSLFAQGARLNSAPCLNFRHNIVGLVDDN